ncbi:MAG: sortase [Rhodoluna sp.]|nr:sortase [Rhodoluna sp.]
MIKTKSTFIQQVLLSVISLLMAFIVNFFILSPLIHATAQNNLRNAFDSEVTLATAPTSEKDYLGHLLPAGAPVAEIHIPKLNLSEVVVEGTNGNTLRTGVGHRRDTVLPGQEGISVLVSRAWSYGGPFGGLGNLKIGDKITAYTAQGKSEYLVSAIRFAGDKGLAPVKAGTSTLVLTSTVGEYFVPQKIIRVDAQMVGTAYTPGLRETKWGAIGPESREMGVETDSAWVLCLLLLGLIGAQVLAIWSAARVGMAKTWLVFAPVLTLGFILLTDQITQLLPNLI